MPYVQVDLPNQYPFEVKRDLARRLGDAWSEIMQTTPDLVDVCFRELGAGNVWRCGRGLPESTAVILLELRKGRPPEQRARLAKALIDECSKTFDIRPDHFSVEFTHHTGDETFRYVQVDGVYEGGFAPDWTPEEVNNESIFDSVPELRGRAH